jgi:hypothetical protein
MDYGWVTLEAFSSILVGENASTLVTRNAILHIARNYEVGYDQ